MATDDKCLFIFVVLQKLPACFAGEEFVEVDPEAGGGLGVAPVPAAGETYGYVLRSPTGERRSTRSGTSSRTLAGLGRLPGRGDRECDLRCAPRARQRDREGDLRVRGIR